ncbi:hypothetical protein BDB01DRAFT_796451 [Pilobolus umbonatus]|nr:hypothetical protein BDB01DRAFT_796451 [Pilobolus umbonatus]
MEFTWVSDIPHTLKQSSCITTAIQSNKGIHIPPTTTPPPTKSPLNHSSMRRTRADTMPSSSMSAFAFGVNLYNNNNPMTTVAQQRPNIDRITSMADSGDSHLYPSDLSSPLDENASDSIASTLASLGLNDDSTHYFEPITRNRAYTVSARPSLLDRPNVQSLSFSPFLDSTKRPRAISLGMADTAPQSTENHFSPFDMSYINHLEQNNQSSLTEVSSSNLGGNTKGIHYSSRGFSRMDCHEEEEEEMKLNLNDTAPSRLSSPGLESASSGQAPSRALWIGNINSSVSVPDLLKLFAPYGQVESARILSDKECAFVNFNQVESAIAAKDALVNHLHCKVGGTVVKVGFGKADVSLAMALTNEAGPNAQGPTKALWVGNIPSNMDPIALKAIFQTFGHVETIRILSHKNCGFVNFKRQEDAVRARKMLQNKEILGPGTGTVRIGFARAPTEEEEEMEAAKVQPEVKIEEEKKSDPNSTQWATVLLMASMMMNAAAQQHQQTHPSNSSTPALSNTPSPSSSTHVLLNSSVDQQKRLSSERRFIMQQLGYVPTHNDDRIPIHYYAVLPTVPELGVDRVIGPLRLRELKKSLDNGQGIPECEAIAQECMPEIVELCSDYIGNTIVQKLFEFCNSETKLSMLERIAPYLASIGVHKNGTWAAQKIIDKANSNEQIQLICKSIAPYVPILLLDQFGNYVVQCCLRMGHERNQYIFDAIVDKCWDIGQGRFGARAVRAILENPIVTKDQQIYVAASIMQNSLLLTTNPNGSILLNWLLDTSGLLGHYRALCNTN